MRFTAHILGATFLVAAIPAIAADYNGDIPAIPYMPNDGFYLGAIGGYTGGEAVFSTPLYPDFSLADPINGWDGGILVGYQFKTDDYFSAIEIAGMLGGPNKTYTYAPYSLEYGIDGHIDARVRAGYQAPGGIGYNGIVGLSYNNLSIQLSDGVDTYSTNEGQMGWLIGAGIDYEIAPRITIGAEYTYNQLFDKTYDGILTVGGHYHAFRVATRAGF